MFKTQYCHTLLKSSFENLNKARINTLLKCSDGLIRSDELTLTAIGRNLSGASLTKHKIKRVDRLLASDKLLKEKVDIYQQLSKVFIPQLPFYLVAVDWSGCCNANYWVLRASLLVDGRSIVLYNQVVEKEELEQTYIHNTFLDDLSRFFGEQDKVYIIADGGFKTPWIQKIASLGWLHVTRVRGQIHGQLEQGDWRPVSKLSGGATSIPRALGLGKLGKTSKTQCSAYFHLYKGAPKGRKSTGHQYPSAQKTYRSIANEPWLLVTNDDTLNAKQVVTYYNKRMQIEQNFRDDKSQRYGFSWRNSKTTSVKRIEILCLIACIATNVLWFIGFQAERRKLHHQFQANSIKARRVLSFLSLAKNILIHFSFRRVAALFSQGVRNLTKEYKKRIYSMDL